MNITQKNHIEKIVDEEITRFAVKFEKRYQKEVGDAQGVINRKRNNRFITELGDEFIFYSAFVRSFDSAFGKVLEAMGNRIAAFSFTIRKKVDSFLLPQQSQHIDYMILQYEDHVPPRAEDYNGFTCMTPRDITSYKKSHVTDHYFYHPKKKEHYLIELKSGGDLDNKKAKTEKLALLQEYFILKNSLPLDSKDTVKIFLGTAYNLYGEGQPWNQERVKQFFAQDELLIGKAYWNFICDSPDGYDIVFQQYQKSAAAIKSALVRIKGLYFPEEA